MALEAVFFYNAIVSTFSHGETLHYEEYKFQMDEIADKYIIIYLAR